MDPVLVLDAGADQAAGPGSAAPPSGVPGERLVRSGSTSSHGSTGSSKSGRRYFHPFSKGRQDAHVPAGKKAMKGERRSSDKRLDERRGSSWSLGSYGSQSAASGSGAESVASAAADLESLNSEGTHLSLDSPLAVAAASDPARFFGSPQPSARAQQQQQQQQHFGGLPGPAAGARARGSGRRAGPAGEELPPGWSMKYTADGKPYFIDGWNRTTSWLDPRTNRPAINGTQSRRGIEPVAASTWALPLPEGWEMARTANSTPYFIDHKTQRTTWTDPRSVLFRSSSLEGHQQRMKIKELKQANEELQYQITLITQQQRHLEQEVLQSANQETLTLAKTKAMADAQRVLEQQYREMSCRYPAGQPAGAGAAGDPAVGGAHAGAALDRGPLGVSRPLDSVVGVVGVVNPRMASPTLDSILSAELLSLSPTALADALPPSPPPGGEPIGHGAVAGALQPGAAPLVPSARDVRAAAGGGHYDQPAPMLPADGGASAGAGKDKELALELNHLLPGDDRLLASPGFDEYLGSWCV